MVHGECGGGASSYGTPVIATVDGVQRGPRDVVVHVYLKLRLTPRMNARARRGCRQEISVFISESRHRVLAKMARDWWWPRGRYITVVVQWR